MLRAAPSCSEYSQNPHPQKIRVLRAAPSAPQKSPPLKKSECSKLLRVLPKKAIVQKSPPSKSELLRVLRAAPSAPKKLSQKIHHPQKIRVLRAAPSAPKKAIAPKKSPPKAPHPLPSQAPIVRYSALPSPLPSPNKSPHHFVIAPRPTTHYLCFQKSQISHVHKHNAFQFRLRNRNISSS